MQKPAVTAIRPQTHQLYFILALAFALALLLALIIITLHTGTHSATLQSPTGTPWQTIPNA